MVRYEDGSKDVFIEQSEKSKYDISNKSEIMADKGNEDAKAFYKGKNSGSVWTTVTTILTSPIIGAIPAIACSLTEPCDENLNYVNRDLMKDPNYNRAYTKQAHKIKKKKIWSSFGIGSAAWLVLVLIANS